MKHLYIIRHGETEFNKSQLLQGRGINASLNERGLEQGEAVANYLEDKNISLVVTSSLNRAIESASPLLNRIDSTFKSHSEIDEMSFGEWEGQPFSEVLDSIHEIQKTWKSGQVTAKIPGGESPMEVYTRASRKINEIVESSQDEHIAIYIHGRLIRILLSGLLGYGLENMHLIKHENGAINHLTWKSGVYSSVKLNITEHLSHINSPA